MGSSHVIFIFGNLHRVHLGFLNNFVNLIDVYNLTFNLIFTEHDILSPSLPTIKWNPQNLVYFTPWSMGQDAWWSFTLRPTIPITDVTNSLCANFKESCKTRGRRNKGKYINHETNTSSSVRESLSWMLTNVRLVITICEELFWLLEIGEMVANDGTKNTTSIWTTVYLIVICIKAPRTSKWPQI